MPTPKDYLLDILLLGANFSGACFRAVFGVARGRVSGRLVKLQQEYLVSEGYIAEESQNALRIPEEYTLSGLQYGRKGSNVKRYMLYPNQLLAYYGIAPLTASAHIAQSLYDMYELSTNSRSHSSDSDSSQDMRGDDLRRLPLRQETIRGTKERLESLLTAADLATHSLPRSMDHNAKEFHPVRPGDIEPLLSAGVAEDVWSEEQAKLLRLLLVSLPNTSQSFNNSYSKVSGQVRFNNNPAEHSIPNVDELGLNDYKTFMEDARRYGSDTGFIRQITTKAFHVKLSDNARPRDFTKVLSKIGARISSNIKTCYKSDVSKKMSTLLSLSHQADRIDKAGKYITDWITAVGIDPDNDFESYQRLRMIIPKQWLRDAEREVMSRHNAILNREELKKEVASKLGYNHTALKESQNVSLITLANQLQNLMNEITKRYFKDLFDALNSLAESTSLDIKYYKGAANIIKSFALTDNLEDLAILPGADDTEVQDVLANNTASKIVSKLRSYATQALFTKDVLLGSGGALPAYLNINSDQVILGTLRFRPVAEHDWLNIEDQICPLHTTFKEVAMAPGSKLTTRIWALIIHEYSHLNNWLSRYQDTITQRWETEYLEKSRKEEERRAAQLIYAEVKTKL